MTGDLRTPIRRFSPGLPERIIPSAKDCHSFRPPAVLTYHLSLLDLAALGYSHEYWPCDCEWTSSFNLKENGLLINLRGIDGITFNVDKTKAIMQGGALIGQIIDVAYLCE